MDEFIVSYRKKKKSNKTKLNIKKDKTKKRKSRPTREYQQNEVEVRELLENTSLLGLDLVRDKCNNDTQCLEFFCGTSEEEPEFFRKDFSKVAEEQNDTDGYTSDEKEEDEEAADESITKTSSEQSTTQHVQQTTASTYVCMQMDAWDAITNTGMRIKHNFNEELLFEPNNELAINIKLEANELENLHINTIKMFNRFNEESKTLHKQIKLDTIFEALLRNQTIKKSDMAFYRTFSCGHEFHPIFYEPTREPITIPVRKFLKIYIKELRFTEHPQLLEEHRLANQLEDLYAEYSERIKQKLSEKLQADLHIERKIVNELLRREASMAALESPASAAKRAQTLERHLLSVRALRELLYDEEAANKRLLQQVLDAWIKLKSLRKLQQFQCTRLKLRIILFETNDVPAENYKWTQRFEADLNEIYREELEIYYRAKRLWKQKATDLDANIIVKPRKPNITKLGAVLKQRLTGCLYAPDESQIKTVLLNRISDEEFYNIPPAGQRKLKSFFMKLYFDDHYVGTTRSYRLEPDMSTVNEVIGIFLERCLPRDIHIVIYEKSKLPVPRKISTITIPMQQAISKEDSHEKRIKFTSHNETQRQEAQQQLISGCLKLRFHCDDEIYSQDQPTTCLPPLNEAQSKKVNDAIAIEGDEAQKTAEVAEEKTCTFEEDMLQFCSMQELESNQRFKLLHSRHSKNDARTRDLRFIPSQEQEMSFDWKGEGDNVLDAGTWMDAIDVFKHAGKKHLRSIYEAIRTQSERLSKVMESSENLLTGDEPASWSTFFQVMLAIFHPRRPLHPNRYKLFNFSPTVPSLCMDVSQNFKIIFNIVRATGVPIRQSSNNSNKWDREDSRQRSSGSSNMFITQNLKYSNVRPFISLSYSDKICRTMTAEGSNPTWNEQLVLQFSGTIKELRDDVKISLFDEVIENYVNDDVAVRNDIYQRIQANWLGEYRIPISDILTKQKIEGVFELNTPKILLGYKRPTLDNITTNSDTNINIEHYPEIKETIYLWFYLSIEPLFELSHINVNCLECTELKEVRQQLHFWSLEMRELRPQRFLEPLICTADGKRVCITRLLEPVPLPIMASENQLDSVCRFVALLNVFKNYDGCMHQGIWLNNQLLLDTNWGSAKDLAVLLCCYLLTIGLQCWLVLGDSTFVLFRSEESDLMLIDPNTGKRYSTKDTCCPLNRIYIIVAQDNIYFNIQTEERLTMTNFGLRDSSCWLPAFSKRNPAPLGGIQRLNYTYRTYNNTSDLRRNIERKIMKKINNWRTMRKTIWNRAFQTRLSNILQNLEHLTTYTSNLVVEPNYANQLAAEFSNYQLYGFTLNFPYTNLTSISDRIKSTGIHLNSDKNVEFSLAVHIDAYPNNILSIWIFLVSLTPS